jgi:5,10-methylenetetrahydrofolate reductase
MTQVCFDASRTVEFVSSPVYAGVMVAKNAAAMRRVAAMAGIEVPAEMRVDEAFASGGSAAGAHLAGALAADVWRRAEALGSPLAGIHFFGMNDTELLIEAVRSCEAAL